MILVTGGTGLVGSHLLFSLIASGKAVKAIKRQGSNINMVKRVFNYYTDDQCLFEKIEWIEADVLDVCSLEEAMEGISLVYHCAAVVSFYPKDRDNMMKTNLEGTANVVNTALHSKVAKLCYVSSTAAIGKNINGGMNTEDTEWNKADASYYSVSKYLAEQEVWRGREEGLKIVVVNPSIIIGPGDWGKSSTNLIPEVWNGLGFYTSGSNAFVDVRDVVKAMILLTEGETEGERYLLLSENLKFKTFFDEVAKVLGKPQPKIHATAWMTSFAWKVEMLKSKFMGNNPKITKETAKTSQSDQHFSNEKIRKLTGMKFIPVKQSVKDTCEIFLKDLKF